MAYEWRQNIGAYGFGLDDYELARNQGYSDAQLRQFLLDNRSTFGVGRANVYVDVRNRLGLGNEYNNENPGGTPEERGRGAENAYNAYLSALRSKAAAPQPSPQATGGGSSGTNQSSQLDDYRRQLEESRTSYEKQLGDLRGSLDQYRSQFDAARQSYEKTLSERDTVLKQKESDLLKAQADVQSYQADAERYRDLSINSQLRDLRAGAVSGNGPQSGEAPSLSSGIKRPAPAGQRTLVDVRGRIDATDSVLNRRRPVVEVIGSSSSSAPSPSSGSGGGSAGSAAGQGSGAAGYYARRFG